ncbi:hypothetical protein [Botrimarina hoheduenensis]|nr:hypothetical protein [Botrimarina hoheduenensis]
MFQPLQGGQPAQGAIDSEGNFKLSTYSPGDGAVTGRHRVRIVCYSLQNPDLKKSSPGDSLGELLIPERYTSFAQSGFEVSVLAQGNAPFLFRLESDNVSKEEAPAEEGSRSEEANAESSTDDGFEDRSTPDKDVVEK